MTFQEDYGVKQGVFRTFRGMASGFDGMTGIGSSRYFRMNSPIVRVALWAVGLGIVLTAILEVLYIIVTNGTTFYPVVDFLLSISVILTVAVFFMAQGTRAEESLRSSEEKFRDLFDNANDIIQTVDIDGKFTYVNRKWHDILGYSGDDLKELNLWDIIEDDCIEGCRKVLADISRGKNNEHVEAVYISKDGGRIFMEGSVNGRFKNGEFISTRGIFRDVTLRKEMERILESERSQLLSIIDAVSEPAYVSDPETHEILYVNKRLKELLGRDVAGGLCYREFQGLENPCDFCTNDIILKDKENPYYWEHYNTPLGRHYSICDRIIKWSDGRDVRFELAMDITDRKRMENELVESRERYRLITENTDDLIAVCDLSGYYTYVSPSHNALGYDAGELLGSFCWDHVHPDDASELMDRVEGLIDSKMEENRSRMQLRFLDKAGREHELESSMTLIKDSDERPGHIILISRDVTERRQMERDIKYTRDKYLALVENSPEGIIVIQDAKLAFVNNASESLLGFQPDELVGKSFTDLVRPEDMESVVERYRKRMAGEEVPEVYEIQLLRKDGGYIPTEVFASMIDYDGKPADLVFIRDNSERLKMMNKLMASEERFRAITMTAMDAIVKIDQDGNVVIWNPAAEKMFGYTFEEMKGKNFHNIIAPKKYHNAHHKAFKEFRKTGQGAALGQTLELSGLTKAGDEIPVELSLTPIKIDEGWHAIAILRNITDRKAMENELKKSEERYHSLITQSIDGITLTDTDGTILEWNPGMEEITGIPGSEARGIQVWEIMSRLMPPDAKDGKIMERVKNSLVNSMFDPDGEHWGKLMDFKFYNAKLGRIVDVQAMNFPIKAENGVMAASTMRDVSETKKLELAMSGIMKKLEEKNQELEDYTYTVSHDLKAPLVTIQGFSELLTSQYGGELDEKAMHYLDRINQGSENLARLVTDLLELSRAGRKTREFQEHDFNDIVQISAEGLEGRLSQKGVKLEYPDDFPAVHGDDVRLTQVMSNLIGNAANYMGDQKNPKIKIGWERDGDNYVIWVEDNGIGIKEQDRERIFKTFERASDGDNGGTGIGLSIVKKVIQTHGGEIRVESEPGRGSKFIFTIPIKGVE